MNSSVPREKARCPRCNQLKNLSRCYKMGQICMACVRAEHNAFVVPDIPVGMKFCVHCQEVKAKDQFSTNRSKNNARHAYCKACMRTYTKQRLSPQENANRQLWYNYGITRAEYTMMFDRQGGKCACCGGEETHMMRGKRKNLSVDHNHRTKGVRSLLCADCNIAFGHMKECPERIAALLVYAKKWAA